MNPTVPPPEEVDYCPFCFHVFQPSEEYPDHFYTCNATKDLDAQDIFANKEEVEEEDTPESTHGTDAGEASQKVQGS